MKTPSTSPPTSAEARLALKVELRRDVRIIGLVVGLLWMVLLLDTVLFHGQLERLGIVPRTLEGLRGIVFAPLLHVGFGHLIGNTVGLTLLGGLVLLREESDFWMVTVIGAIVGGLGTWLFGRANNHIGASGVIFSYFGYLASTGIFERRFGAVLLSLAAVIGWGGLIFGVLPGQPDISWEGHFFGLLAGIAAASVIARRRYPRAA